MIYDFKILDRLIDYDRLIDNTITSLEQLHEQVYIDGYFGCTLHLTYPDLAMVDRKKGGVVTRVGNLTKRVHRKLSDMAGKSVSNHSQIRLI